MTPQAAAFLEKARQLLSEAAIMLTVGLSEAAGRSAYLAAFHSAQAFIFERTGNVPKTHKGVQTEFVRLTRNDTSIDVNLARFLSRAYNLKSIADYETGPTAKVTLPHATDAVASAGHFVAELGRLLER